MYTDHRTAPVDKVAKFAPLVGWDLALFGGVLATSEPEWRWTPAVPITAVLTPDTYTEGGIRGLRDWYAPVSTKPAADVAWESVLHVKGQTSVAERVQYRH
eukprot:4342499-Pleurochrysis_carterae.AAC.1